MKINQLLDVNDQIKLEYINKVDHVDSVKKIKEEVMKKFYKLEKQSKEVDVKMVMKHKMILNIKNHFGKLSLIKN